jgi:hypothetical protein
MLTFGCVSKTTQDGDNTLYELFQNPPVESKPFVRWWWNGNKICEEEILRELDIMKAAGIGGVEINPIAFPDGGEHAIPSLQWLSPEWIENVRIALEGAEERGMKCDILCGSGWPFGGEFLKSEEQCQLLTASNRKVQGRREYKVKLQYFIDDAVPQIISPHVGMSGELYSLSLIPLRMSSFSSVINVNYKRVGEDIVFEVPDGVYVLCALVKFTGFQAVINGAPGASGPVLNHYDEKAVRNYLSHFSSSLFPDLKSAKNLRAVFSDSMEGEGTNWCDDFPAEFQRRRGYNVKPYLPFIIYKTGYMGHAVGKLDVDLPNEMRDEINRVRYDFTITCMELVQERFLNTFTQWCREHGLQSRVQAYGKELHPLEASMVVDIPEGESWMRHGDSKSEYDFVNAPAYMNVNKFVSSAAHLTGRRIVSVEDVTNTNFVFNATLERIKITSDQSVLSGMTHSVLHGFNYSPPDIPFPGWIRYGTFFNERNPWWRYLEQWTTYKSRISAVMQNSEYFADIAVLHPLGDMWSLYGPQRDPFPALYYPDYQYNVWEGIHRNGNACDYVSEKIIQGSACKDGFLNYGNRKYHTLILLKVESIMPETAEMLLAFVKNGGKVIFVEMEPHKSPGLNRYRENDRKVGKIVKAMKEECPHSVYTVEPPRGDVTAWFAKLQRECSIEPYLKFSTTHPFVSQIRRQTEEQEIYFITNCDMNRAASFDIDFPHKNEQAWLWDPETGERYLYPVGKKGKLRVELDPAASKLIVFEKRKMDGNPLPVPPPKNANPLHVEKWRVTMQHINGEISERSATGLPDWSTLPETCSFAGELVYVAEVENSGGFNYLDLGKVYGVSEVRINGERLGSKWYGRHLYQIHPELRNLPTLTIEVTVTTTVGNYLKSDPKNKVGQLWTHYQEWQPVGMLGPVRIL